MRCCACPLVTPYIRDRGEILAHIPALSARTDGRIGFTGAGKALGKSIVDRFLVRTTGRFCAEEMSFPEPSYTASHRSFSISHRALSFLSRWLHVRARGRFKVHRIAVVKFDVYTRYVKTLPVRIVNIIYCNVKVFLSFCIIKIYQRVRARVLSSAFRETHDRRLNSTKNLRLIPAIV